MNSLRYMYFDWTILLLLPAFILSIFAQSRVNRTFNKYSKVISSQGMTGEQTARKILDANGIGDVKIERQPGNLTDHYDPATKTVKLSEGVYGVQSISAIGVAAHEVGHAIQHAKAYQPVKVRNFFVPSANIGSRFGPWMVIFGIVLSIPVLINIGIVLFSLAVLFYLVTLPVEFDASKRAVACLENYGMIYSDEIDGVKKVLGAAALTYVAAAAMAVSNLLRLVLLSNRRR